MSISDRASRRDRQNKKKDNSDTKIEKWNVWPFVWWICFHQLEMKFFHFPQSLLSFIFNTHTHTHWRNRKLISYSLSLSKMGPNIHALPTRKKVDNKCTISNRHWSIGYFFFFYYFVMMLLLFTKEWPLLPLTHHIIYRPYHFQNVRFIVWPFFNAHANHSLFSRSVSILNFQHFTKFKQSADFLKFMAE